MRLDQSFAPLAPEDIARINPQKAFSRNTIGTLDMPELQGPATSDVTEGTADFSMPGEPNRSRWVAGFASLTVKPWRVFVVEPEAQFAAPMAASSSSLRGR